MNIKILCLYSCLCYPTGKPDIFCATLYSVYGLSVSVMLSTPLSQKRYDFREKLFIEIKMCISILSTNFFF